MCASLPLHSHLHHLSKEKAKEKHEQDGTRGTRGTRSESNFGARENSKFAKMTHFRPRPCTSCTSCPDANKALSVTTFTGLRFLILAALSRANLVVKQTENCDGRTAYMPRVGLTFFFFSEKKNTHAQRTNTWVQVVRAVQRRHAGKSKLERVRIRKIGGTPTFSSATVDRVYCTGKKARRRS